VIYLCDNIPLMKKIIIIHTIVLALVIGAGAFAYAKYWNIATVNGRPISRLSYIKVLEKQGGKEVLDQMVNEALILNEGKNKNVVVTQKDIDAEIAKVEDRLKAQNMTLDAALTANGMVKEDLVSQIRLKKIQDALSASKAEITQAQIDAFLKANKAMLPTGKTPAELNTLAKDQLILEANQASASAWLAALKSSAKVVYSK
jgi:foldase protein PrsA